MAIKLVNRADPSGTLTDPADPTKDQVLNSSLLVQLSDDTTEAEATIRQIIENAVNDAVIRALQNVTRDLRYNATETWATAGDSAGLHATGATFGNTELQAVTDWAAAYTVPNITESTGSVVIRIPEGANPHDYRILLEDGSYRNFDASLLVGFGTLSGFDVYLTVISFIGDYAVGKVLTLQHHGVDAHTDFLGGVPELETAIRDITSDLGGKQDVRPFDVFLDRNYYVRTNRDPITYYLILHNIVTGLIAGVDNIRATVRGQLIHSAAFNPATAVEQVVPIELSATEIGNIVNNLRTDTSVNFEIEFRDGSTVVESVRIQVPVLDAPPVRERRILMALDLTRTTKTNVLPDNYGQYRKMLIGTYSGRNTNESFQPIPIAALTGSATLTAIGSNNNHKFDWNRTTRTITYDPEQSANSSGIIYLELTS